MNYKETAKKVVELVGGKENIQSHTHCMTRLRFVINDASKIKEEELKALPEVQGIVNKGGQYQLIIGQEVEFLYNEVIALCPTEPEIVKKEIKPEKEAGIVNQILGFISGCITPALPILIGSGLISAVLALLVQFAGMDKASSTYVLLNALANAAFDYLPVYVAFAAARRLKTNEYLAAFIMLALCSATVNNVADLTLFGLPVMKVKYTANIVPALFMVPVMSMLDKLIMKVTPEQIKSVVRPFVLAIVMFPLTLFVLGPIGTIVGQALANFCVWATSFGGLSMALLSAFHPILVMVGMHTLITPLIVNEIATVGSSLLFSKALAANLAIGGAALAVGFKAKKQENKEAGISTGITACLSVTEPAVYGCLLRLKKPFLSAIIASAITGVFIGIFDIRAYATASCSFLTLPIFMGGEMSNFYLACAAAVIAVILGFAVTWFIGFDED